MKSTACLPALLGACVLVSSPGVLGAQQRDPTAGIAPHVRAALWPERPLSPEEQRLKQHVIVLRDTLAIVDGSAALLQRQQRGAASSGVLRSSGYRLAADCAVATRASKVMAEYAGDLTTDDAKWGQPAVRSFQSGVARLLKGMAACEASITGSLGTEGGPDATKLAKVAAEAQAAVADYTKAATGLINTLEIRLDPRGSGSPGR